VAGRSAFGAEITRTREELRVSAGALHAADAPIDARNSGTTLRLLTGVAALFEGETVLTGDSSLRKRPMGPLLDALESLGAHARSLGGDGRAPVEIRGALHGGRTSLTGGVSSQFLSSLLIVCPLADGPSEIRVVPPLLSVSFLEMTRRTMRSFGVEVD